MLKGFVKKRRRSVRRQINIYLHKYSFYVKYIVKKRIYLREHWDDMEQFISMELIKLYPKKFKYTDFDWVVRSAIRRKAIDFDAKIKRSYKNLIFENQKSNPLFSAVSGRENNAFDADVDTDTMFYSGIKSLKKWNGQSIDEKIIDFVNDIIHKITEGRLKDEFTEWDREYLDSLMFLYGLGYREFPKEDIVECMGYDLSDMLHYSSKLNSFRNRLKKHFSLEMDLNL